MKSLLAVSWWYPPLLGPRSIQVAKSLANLAKRGWNVHVITAGLDHLPIGIAKDNELLDRYGQNVKISRSSNLFRSRIGQFSGKLDRRLAPIPDAQVFWAQKASKRIAKDRQLDNYDVLASFGQPWSSHILGRAVAIHTGLPWLAHFSDPWADNPYNGNLLPKQLQTMQNLERQTVVKANSLVFTNQATVNLTMKKYEEKQQKKAVVIPHGFDGRLINELSASNFQMQANKLTLLHAGNIYGIRRPHSLFEALRLLKKDAEIYQDLELVLLGAISKDGHWKNLIQEMGISEVIRFEKRVSYMESLAIAKKADVLITLDAASNGASVFLPSKLVDYLGLDRVILGITPEQGVSADLLRSLDMPIADPESAQEIAEEIRKLHSLWKTDNLKVGKEKSKIIDQYEIEATSNLLEETLLGLI
jgi:glycosyltransferase involved in cell wall biosynthesis